MVFEDFQSRRLKFEPINSGHAARLFNGLQDSRIYRWISASPPRSVEQLADAWSSSLTEGATPPHEVNYNWAIQRRDDGAWIGKMDAEIKSGKIALNLGYLFFPRFWRRGYATEAILTLADHLEREGIVEQRAYVTAGNTASMKALENAGFIRGRVLKDNDTIRGVAVDDVEYIRRVAG